MKKKKLHFVVVYSGQFFKIINGVSSKQVKGSF